MTRPALTRLFGPLLALGVALLGVLAAVRAPTPDAVAVALRDLGTLLTVVTGLFSALWWHRSTGDPTDMEHASLKLQQELAALNRAAATTTGLALLGGVYTGLPWLTAGSALAAAAFLLLLGMSGREILLAGLLSFRGGLTPRATLAVVALTLASLLFVYRHVLR